MSVGVARQCSGALGKVGNCRIGVSINAASEQASCPLDWRLFIPTEYDEESEFNRQRRSKAHLPEDVHHVEKWRLALGMIDELRDWGVEPPVILGDGAYGYTTELRTSLEGRRLDYVLEVKGETSAYEQGVQPELLRYKGNGRPPKPRYREASCSLKAPTLAAGPSACVTVTRREGTRGKMSSGFLALRVRPANITLRNNPNRNGEQLPLRWLICEWSPEKDQPSKYWLSNLPAETTLTELGRLGKLRRRIERDYRELKDALGLDHFEGRTYRGFRHHLTLVSVAHAFLTLERTRRPRTRAAA
jgi:SRSO17 transposase